jgi:type IV fimbrial biogenesis protein FimT
MPSQKPALQNQHGQSLIETLFVLFVLAVMCGVVASSMRWVQHKIQIQTAAEDMLNALLTARTEALRREKRVTLCVAEAVPFNALPGQCAAAKLSAGGASASWQQGWLMFVDDNSNGIWDPTEALLQQHPSLAAAVSATGNSTVNRYVSFGANGRSLILNGGFQAGTLTFCERDALASSGWLLVINAIGRPRLERAQVANCL